MARPIRRFTGPVADRVSMKIDADVEHGASAPGLPHRRKFVCRRGPPRSMRETELRFTGQDGRQVCGLDIALIGIPCAERLSRFLIYQSSFRGHRRRRSSQPGISCGLEARCRLKLALGSVEHSSGISHGGGEMGCCGEALIGCTRRPSVEVLELEERQFCDQMEPFVDFSAIGKRRVRAVDAVK